MKLSLKAITIILSSTILAAILLDAFVVTPRVPWLSRAIGVKVDLVILATPFSIPKFGVIVPYGLLLVVVAVLLVPLQSLTSVSAWKRAGATWIQIVKWSLAVPGLLIVGGFLYKMTKGYLPDWLKAFAESFGVAAKVFIFDHEFFPVDGSLATLLALAVGVYLFLSQGVQKGLRSKSGFGMLG